AIRGACALRPWIGTAPLRQALPVRRASFATPARVAWFAVLLGGLGALAARARESLRAPGPDLHAVTYVGSAACRRCHTDHYASWARTHHGRMTRDVAANGEAVLGAFDGRRLAWFGWDLELARDASGAPRVRATGPAGESRDWIVGRTVGSRRMQQYLAREPDGTWWRLPVAWHVGEQRFVHMNGAFLTPDPEHAAAPAEDFERHLSRWNDNCVFCHNVAPRPAPQPAGGFATEVAELGVACEACHGPGAAHAAANADPLRRYALHYGDGDDATVVDPARLSAERSAGACGRCHGQRKTGDLAAVLREGEGFVPGDDLARTSEPLWADTTLNGEEDVFRARFWPDGSPRLTAYEYQGQLLSPCSQRGDATCTTCHGMHTGDPAGQLRPELGEDGSCVGCHAGAAEDGHARAGHEAVACVDCHLPRNVYGVLAAHRTHRVQVPSPGGLTPDACTTCHVCADPTSLGGRRGPSMHARLFGGDPVERALAADALGRHAGQAVPEAERATERAAALGALLLTLRDDPYPAVRRLAFEAAQKLGGDAPWADYRPGSARAPREVALTRIEATLRARGVRWTPPGPEARAHLAEAGREGALWIGE
ncbi:MAG: multiheme c-type cytochrome, partial [Myxococcota bacterium]